MEQLIILDVGEWWKLDTEKLINQALKSWLVPNVSDAHTINGHPGRTHGCQTQGGFHLSVDKGKSYKLLIVNAALNEELFFKIAGHKLTVVEVDAVYVKPFKTNTIVIAPGQTTNAIITADKKSGKYMMIASPFMDSPIAVDNKTATATIHYTGILSSSTTILTTPSPQMGLGINPYPTCKAGNGSQVVAGLNNVTFVMPTTGLLQAHYFKNKRVFTTDFPGNPHIAFNYAGTPPTNMATNNGTKLYRLKYNSTIQLVLQDTSIIAAENHQIHLHGFNFFAVGKGIGNYNPKADPKKFNFVYPVERNTIGVPSGGWVAIRFRADNPGEWFLHCHLEIWKCAQLGVLKMAFLVDNGNGPNESVLQPPKDLPKC